ncbi:hypothetical protein [Flavivirga spongiicola]|uniref:Uncharacterized protein n=1 Tax=Flavivirga spongiicola TaxID=421621 RepID=A0ABU7Y1Q9_9FLAO|nr:hypothetical protein [Flavivirga sp. MEBiC05379]MDO5981064.1 hypothetical protein [Flavivirga sp. MEBiC05379]
MLSLSFRSSVEQVAINETFHLLTNETEFEVGSTIVLKFSTSNSSKPNLYLSNSYGSIILKPVLESGVLNYLLPKSFSNKKGVINWKLLSNNTPLSGKFNMHSKQEVATMETYLGPPSIEAGGTDYTMLVVIPTDSYDNPLKDSTQVLVKHQFLANESHDVIYMKNGISYKNIFSELKTGRMLIGSESLSKNSKEYDVNVLPAIPTDFTIAYNRNHEYADGNQITNFSTSIIKDKNNNVVSDGTYVDFFITNTSNHVLKTSGSTINGIATAKMIHPDHQDSWTVKAFIEGMAESNSIALIYKQAVLDFQVIFSEDNRTVTIGPLKSFMNQMIPDGLEVKLHMYQNDTKIKTLNKSSFEGYTSFKLNSDIFPENMYTFKLETAGIEKTYQNIKL